MRIAAIFLISAAVLPANTIYSITDLGGMSGGFSTASAINASGSVVGFAETPTGYYQAFSSSGGGAMQNLSAPSASNSYAYGINNSGAMAGMSYVNGQPHGLIWTGTGLVDLGAGTYATGINNSGAVVGGNGQAFLYSNGTMQNLGYLSGGDWSAAYGVNDAGTVVGYGTLASGICRGFIWSANGGMTAIGTFGGANSYANAVNNGGAVVGEASLANGYQNAFVDLNGVMTDLGTLDGGNSLAYGINDSGSIVGYSWGPNDANPSAFLYSNGKMADLNSFLAAGSGWQLLEAYGINNAGDIVGSGLFNGVPSSFELAPGGVITAAPEPSAIPVIALVLAAFAISLRLRRLQPR